jgi:hypothetical protein
MNVEYEDPGVLLERLLQKNPTSVLQWLGDVDEGKRPSPARFNWLGLAEAAADYARSSDVKSSNLEWARAAIAAYEQLVRSDEGTRNFGEDSSMTLRAAMIGIFGPTQGDAVLDPDIILRWFTNELDVTLPDAEKSIARWRSLGPRGRSEAYERELTLAWRLRRVKNRLRAIDALSRVSGVTLTDYLRQWLALREELP